MIKINNTHLEGLLLALEYCTKYEDKMFLNFMINKAKECKSWEI